MVGDVLRERARRVVQQGGQGRVQALALAKPTGARVTLLHVLTHTSGVADDADEEAGEDYEALFHDVPNYRVLTPRDQLPGRA